MKGYVRYCGCAARRSRFRITTQGHYGSRQTARVKTYGDVVTEYEFHPESKCADASGKPCEKQTTGLLGTATHQNRSHQMYRQGVEQFGRSRRGLGSLRGQVLHGTWYSMIRGGATGLHG